MLKSSLLPSFSQLINTGMEFPCSGCKTLNFHACGGFYFPWCLPCQPPTVSQEPDAAKGERPEDCLVWGHSLRGCVGWVLSPGGSVLAIYVQKQCDAATGDVNSGLQGGPPSFRGPEMVHLASHHPEPQPSVLLENKQVPKTVYGSSGQMVPLGPALPCAPWPLNSRRPLHRYSWSRHHVFPSVIISGISLLIYFPSPFPRASSVRAGTLFLWFL